MLSPRFYLSIKYISITYHLMDFYQVWSVLRFFWLVPVFVLGFRFHLALQVEVQLCCSPTFLPNWLLTWLVFKFINKREKLNLALVLSVRGALKPVTLAVGMPKPSRRISPLVDTKIERGGAARRRSRAAVSWWSYLTRARAPRRRRS